MITDHLRPDIVMMGGDLISDGGTDYQSIRWRKISTIPKLRRELLFFLNTHKDTLKLRKPREYEEALKSIKKNDREALSLVRYLMGFAHYGPGRRPDLEKSFCNQVYPLSQAYNDHIQEFYQALKHSSENYKAVFVVMGNHDKGLQEAYLTQINSHKNIHEISGKKVVYNNLRILGLGYMETHYLQKLRRLSELYRDKIDIILTHSEQRRMLEIAAWIRPKIIIRGHFGGGITKIKNSLVVGIGGFPNHYALIQLRDGSIENIEIWFYCNKSEKLEKCTESCFYSSCFLEREKQDWPWQQRIVKSCPIRT